MSERKSWRGAKAKERERERKVGLTEQKGMLDERERERVLGDRGLKVRSIVDGNREAYSARACQGGWRRVDDVSPQGGRDGGEVPHIYVHCSLSLS